MDLQGFHHQMWSNEATGQTLNIVMFDDTVRAFKGQLLESEDYKNEMDFIR
jgi:hypothetical protein